MNRPLSQRCLWQHEPPLLERARLRSLCAISRVVDPLRGWRVIGKFVRRATWAGNQLPSAVWTLSAEYVFGARSAERALEGADTRFRRLGRQVFVAAFAIRPKLQHKYLQKDCVQVREWKARRLNSPAMRGFIAQRPATERSEVERRVSRAVRSRA